MERVFEESTGALDIFFDGVDLTPVTSGKNLIVYLVGANRRRRISLLMGTGSDCGASGGVCGTGGGRAFGLRQTRPDLL